MAVTVVSWWWCDSRRWLGRATPAAAVASANCADCCQRDQNVMAAKLLGSKRNFYKV
ncbi:hypothetical protein ES332_D01G248000v1 [Gossypium tomentosum]|uniref:Uncharacterized protein n=1 Tax=Gossypium tomentosum TaxID=34277 RepID=A0A5D2MD08_GOSTO|nr:hypothetical protein ES332_D01G248000v1 [Gossypium tomentosum]